MAFHLRLHLFVAILLIAAVSCYAASLSSDVTGDGHPSATTLHGNRRPFDEYRERRSRHEYSEDEEEDEDARGYRRRAEKFLMERSMRIIKTEAGEFRVLPRPGSESFLSRNRLGLGFLSLEPKALLLPQYTDTDFLFVVYKGKGRFSWIDGNDLREIDVEEGDAYTIESGTVFHFYNVDEGQRFHVFSIHDSSFGQQQAFQSYFIAGGQDPESVLSGFDEGVLATSFNVSPVVVQDILDSQRDGAIIFSVDRNESRPRSGSPPGPASTGAVKYVKQFRTFQSESENSGEYEAYNILKKSPDFSNEYGSTSAADGNDFSLLKNVNKGLFSVRLKAGAVLAPHWNSRAAEIAIVTKGKGEVQIVHPNGTLAAKEEVSEGIVFYVPKNFPMCQIASRGGPLEFIGFTTSSLPNRPQFLAGSSSVLRKLNADVLAASFSLPVEHIRKFLESQLEAVVLPGMPVKPEGSSRHSEARVFTA